MKRQARGGGRTATADTSVARRRNGETAEGDGFGEEHGDARLSRRLGRADLRAVPEARRALRELLEGWGRPGRSETAELLTSELVTNALVHTDDDALLTATVSSHGLRVEVRDSVPGRPQPGTPTPDESTNGRGLVLVESLADAWGVRTQDAGKVVWFELAAGAA